MREHGTDDDDLIIIKEHPVHVHWHVHREQPARKPADLTGRDHADGLQRRGIVPSVIEKTNPPIRVPSFRFRDLQPPANGRLAHRLVGAERDEDVEGLGRLTNLPVKRLKEEPHRRGPGPVRDDEQNLFVAIILGGARLRDHSRHLLASQ